MKSILLDFDTSKFPKVKPRKSKEQWLADCRNNEIKLFTKPPKEGEYLFDLDKAIGYFPNHKKSEAQAKVFNIYVARGLHVPLVEDTEFTTVGNELSPKSRTHLTTQIKGIAANAPTYIYSNHPEILACKEIGAKKPRFELHALDYITDLGYKVSDFQSCHPWESENLPPLTLTKYSHFALAELLMVCHGTFQKAVLEKVKCRQIAMQRRMTGLTKVEGGTRDFVDFDWKVRIEDLWFKLRIRWIDTCALHGVASYEGLASASGTDLPHKKILDDLKDKTTGQPLSKADMFKIALQYPNEFKLYAEGDLKVYDILVNNKQQMEKVYQGMGLEMKKAPKLTIGGTVKDLFEAALEKNLLGNLSEDEITENDCNVKKIIENFISEATANSLKLNSRDTKALLAKVEGGRCRNHQPIMISKNGIWIDIDIKGCYGEGQRNQLYPIGNPVIFSYPINKAKNEYITLRSWLKKMKWGTAKNDLVPGAWFARISSNGQLKYAQDFFASWFLSSGTGVDILAKYVQSEMKSNSENFAVEDTFLDTDDGELKIFEHEIHNAVLTHDGLQWILNVASKRQRNELLDNLLIVSSMHYPASQRIKNSDKAILELAKKYNNWDGKNKTYYDVKTCTITRVENQPHAWIGLKLDEVIIDKLLENRGLAKFNYGKKSPLEQMYKLCTNTLYGDLVSKFFAISNTCAGNGITARARALAWYMEKGLYGVQSITDGCGFNPNKVLFPGRDLVDGECVAMHRSNNLFVKGKLRLSGLGNSKWHGDKNGLYCDGIQIGKWKIEDGKKEYVDINNQIATLAMKHLQTLFPNVDVLHAPTESLDIIQGQLVRTPRIGQFSFEVKDIYKSITSHGSANYKFVGFEDNEILYKCRGYESKKSHTALIENEEVIERYSNKAPIIDFLDQLESNSNKVTRQNVALKQGILKIGQYLESQSRYDAMGLMPGDNVAKSLLVVEFSLSQFTFKTHKQYKMWKSEVERLKGKTGQSLEVFFLNKDGTLNYQKMIETVDKMIADDIVSPLKHLDPHNHRNRKGIHPAKKTLDEYRDRKPEKVESAEIQTEKVTNVEEFEGVGLNVGDDFDELFGFSPPESPTSSLTNVEEFEGVKLSVGDDFDALFGFS
jgi:hypothetical protein